ncbi:proteasome subunit alpha type-4-like [Teleopsis dalmanni]|uniref:proteasome subunit alpha type-4-like n=1 Tax=Teleopsis dalmanni TaxID=139649 RepID=UPI000D32D2CC|nr:proteasome subunit alpha type-4-like [Teleopsis dalmanni]
MAKQLTSPKEKPSSSCTEEFQTITELDTTAILNYSEKLFLLEEKMTWGMSGTEFDIGVLANALRTVGQKYADMYWVGVPHSVLAYEIFRIKQINPQYGNYQPISLNVTYMDWDMRYNYQLFEIDSSGRSYVWMYTAIGKDCETIMSIMQEEVLRYNYKISLEQAKKMALKAFLKVSKLSPITEEKIVLKTLQRKNGVLFVEPSMRDEIKHLMENIYDEKL